MKTEIPKIIHLCWLSGDKYPENINRCIQSWKRIMPNYEIMLWDSERFKNEISNKFAQEAYNVKKWAFVADYIRLFALKKYGGIYLDSDVCVYKPFDCFLQHGFFSCIEYFKPTNYVAIEAAVMGAKPNHPFIIQCLSLYDNISFIKQDGKYEETTITMRMANIAYEDWGFEYRPIKQELKSDMVIYPPVTFTNPSGEFSSSKTYALHLCNGSWIDNKISYVDRICIFCKRYYKNPALAIENIYKKIVSYIKR